ncbi:MAG TPA: hypothetical protein VIF34_07350 [Methylocystis sp.]
MAAITQEMRKARPAMAGFSAFLGGHLWHRPRRLGKYGNFHKRLICMEKSDFSDVLGAKYLFYKRSFFGFVSIAERKPPGGTERRGPVITARYRSPDTATDPAGHRTGGRRSSSREASSRSEVIRRRAEFFLESLHRYHVTTNKCGPRRRFYAGET